MDKLRVLIVDDSIVYRKILVQAVEATGVAIAAQTASNGILALERLEQDRYDVALMDVNMPELDGIATLKRIRVQYPQLTVIMISSAGAQNAAVTLDALAAGALDFIVKPLEADYDQNLKMVRNHLQVLFAQIQMASLATWGIAGPKEAAAPRPEPGSRPTAREAKLSGVDLIVMAASTGGPMALEAVLKGFARGFAKPILIVQHMPPDYTKVLAQNLERKSQLKVIEGRDGDIIRAGQAIIAPGGYHLTVQLGAHANRTVKLDQNAYVQGVRPAADVLFKSVAESFKRMRILAVILTGMGMDGKAGVAELKAKCQCHCLAQSEATCVVYGMPRSVAEAGLADELVGIDAMAGRIQEIVQNGS
jgi:two-component system chemotaxis response regulator CheB